MKILSSSPQSIVIIQCASLISTILALFIANYSVWYLLLSVIMFYCYSIVGISMMLHRYYSHKSFSLSPPVARFLTLFAVLAGRGSPLGWTYIHRLHHSTSDTERDPHTPHYGKFALIGFKPQHSGRINHFIVKELLTPFHINIDRYYVGIIAVILLIVALIDYNTVLWGWSIPVLVVSISQTLFNYFAHMRGYRNFETADRSTNNIWLWPLICGDAWHNNHHANAGRLSTKHRWWELDPLCVLVNIIRSDG